MPAMKKKKKKNILTAVLVALIVLAIAAIVYVVMFHPEEPVGLKPPLVWKKQTTPSKDAAREKDRARKSTKTTDQVLPLPSVPGKPAERELAKAVPPRAPGRQMAIIIDDIGYDMKPVRELLGIDADITFAILPLVAHSREAAQMLHKAHRETLLHLPMEPLSYPKEKPGSGALFTDMNHEEIVFQLEKNMDSVPFVSGVNNHMGSKFMADEDKLILVFKQLKKRDLFFIDSRTTHNSKTTAAAQKVHLTVASRKIFLDNERDYSKIYQILMEAAEASGGESPLIVIGHPHPETIRAIRDAHKVYREKGVSIVPVSTLIKKKNPEGAS